jgi:hypothetical protein
MLAITGSEAVSGLVLEVEQVVMISAARSYCLTRHRDHRIPKHDV